MQTIGQNGYVMRDPYTAGGSDTWNRDATAQAVAQQQQEQQPTIPGGVITVQTPGVIPQGDSDNGRLRHGLSEQVIGNPISVDEAYRGSMQALLTREIGSYIGATFLIGTGQMLRANGRLVEVGNDYIVIHQEDQDRYVVGDLNSLRFVEFAESGNVSRGTLQSMCSIADASI